MQHCWSKLLCPSKSYLDCVRKRQAELHLSLICLLLSSFLWRLISSTITLFCGAAYHATNYPRYSYRISADPSFPGHAYKKGTGILMATSDACNPARATIVSSNALRRPWLKFSCKSFSICLYSASRCGGYSYLLRLKITVILVTTKPNQKPQNYDGIRFQLCSWVHRPKQPFVSHDI